MPLNKPNTKSVYMNFQENAISIMLHLLNREIKIISDKDFKAPKRQNQKDLLTLHATIRNDLRKALKGLTAIRSNGCPITNMEDWGRVAVALKIIHHQGEQDGMIDEDYLRVFKSVEQWMGDNTYDPSSPEEQAKRKMIRDQFPQTAIRLGKFSVDEILPLIQMVEDKKDSHKIMLAGMRINICSKRLQNFKAHGVKCVTCGLVGEYFSLEYHKNDKIGSQHPHLNLYGIEDGIPVLMTHDHINPRSNGGADKLANMQTMCSPCNGVKGSRHPK